MEFYVKQNDLVKALKPLSKIAKERTTMLALSNVLVTALNDKVELLASDGAVTMKIFVDAKVKEAGCLAVPAKQFYNWISNVSKQEIKVKIQKNNKLRISAGKSWSALNVLPSAEYPYLLKVDDEDRVCFKMDSSVFAKAIKQITFSAVQDNIRAELNAINIEVLEDRLVLVTADGVRLSRVDLFCKNIPAEIAGKSAMIPSKQIAEIVSTLPGLGDEVYVVFDDNSITMECGSAIMKLQSINGEYIAYERLLDGISVKTTVFAKISDAKEASKRVNFFVGEDFPYINLIWDKGETLIIATLLDKANAVIAGSSEDEIQVYGGEGEEISATVNSEYLLDAISAVDTPDVAILNCLLPNKNPMTMVKNVPLVGGDSLFVHILAQANPEELKNMENEDV